MVLGKNKKQNPYLKITSKNRQIYTKLSANCYLVPMKILVVAATKAELTNLYTHFNLPQTNFVSTLKFDVLITGVGMVATAFALGKYITQNYKLVLNLGIAGSFNKNLKIGTILNVTIDVFAELGAQNSDNFITINELGLGNNTYSANHQAFINKVDDLTKANGITVNKVHGEQKSINTVIKLFNPDVESMEGAAVFYACNQMQMPCIQIRSISNLVTPRNTANWNIPLANNNLIEWAIKFLENSLAPQQSRVE